MSDGGPPARHGHREGPRLGGPRRIGSEGEPEVFAADEQADVPVEPQRWSELAEAVLLAEGVRGAAELSLLFVTEQDMAELNERFMEVEGPTDVLAFPLDAVEAEVFATPSAASSGPDRPSTDPGDLPLLLGDVVVCPAVAARQAADHAGTLDDELALLVVHGVLHVLGYDHAEDDEAAHMRARERELLEALHWHGPAPDGFRQEHPDVPAPEAASDPSTGEGDPA